MKTKIKELLGSIRFWIVTLTAITAILANVAEGLELHSILDIVTVYFATVAAIGTLDSIAVKSAK